MKILVMSLPNQSDYSEFHIGLLKILGENFKETKLKTNAFYQ